MNITAPINCNSCHGEKVLFKKTPLKAQECEYSSALITGAIESGLLKPRRADRNSDTKWRGMVTEQALLVSFGPSTVWKIPQVIIGETRWLANSRTLIEFEAHSVIFLVRILESYVWVLDVAPASVVGNNIRWDTAYDRVLVNGPV